MGPMWPYLEGYLDLKGQKKSIARVIKPKPKLIIIPPELCGVQKIRKQIDWGPLLQFETSLSSCLRLFLMNVGVVYSLAQAPFSF